MEIDYLADHLDFAPAIAEWQFKEWGGFADGDSVERRIEFLRAGANRRAIPATIVAIENGELRGSATLAVYDMETRRDLMPWLADVYVIPEFRKRGIGSALCRRVALEAKHLQVAELYLFTTGPRLERLYAGLGWTVIGRPEYRGVTRVLMSLRP